MRKRTGIWAVTALLVGLATACDPPPPLPTFVVDATGAAADATPGDGTCATAQGSCTLAAAIDEGNALGRASVSVPPESYDLAGETVTGDIRVNDRHPVHGLRLTGRVAVAAGGSLLIDGALSNYANESPPPSGLLRFRVDGQLVLRNVQLAWGGATETLVHIGPTGLGLLDTSFVGTSFTTDSMVVNEGRLFLRHSWLMDAGSVSGAFALLTTGAGVSVTSTSIFAPIDVTGLPPIPSAGCGGTPPTSWGYNASETGSSCGLSGVGDRPLADLMVTRYSRFGGQDYDPDPAGSLVDAIPPGVHGCGSEPWGDWYQQPRPVDGDGDGVAECDIGPKELQTSAGSASGAPSARAVGGAWGLDR